MEFLLYTLAVLLIIGYTYVSYNVYKKHKERDEFKKLLRKGDVVKIKNGTYPTARIVEIDNKKAIVSLIVPKNWIYHKDSDNEEEDFD